MALPDAYLKPSRSVYERVNLLAGRVIVRAIFPLVAEELGSDFSVDAVLRLDSQEETG
jgi:hypothetical protein